MVVVVALVGLLVGEGVKVKVGSAASAAQLRYRWMLDPMESSAVVVRGRRESLRGGGGEVDTDTGSGGMRPGKDIEPRFARREPTRAGDELEEELDAVDDDDGDLWSPGRCCRWERGRRNSGAATAVSGGWKTRAVARRKRISSVKIKR